MTTYSTSLKVWGSSGSEYPDNYNYADGEQPVDAWDNFFNSNVVSDIDTIIAALNNDVVQVDGSNSISATLTFDDHTQDPTTNGEIARNGADVKIYSGGTARNLSNIGKSDADLNLPSKDIAAGDFTALARYPSLPSTTTLHINRSTISNGSFGTPSGLQIIVRDVTNGTNLATYSGHSEPNDSFDISGIDVVIAADNGNFGTGTSSEQSNVTASVASRIE